MNRVSSNKISRCIITLIFLLLAISPLLADDQAISETQINLTKAESNWLKKHKTLTIGTTKNWPPIDFIGENQQHSGISADYLKLIEKYSGIHFTTVSNISWDEVLEQVKNGDLDGILSIAQTEKRSSFLNFSDPYTTMDKVILTHQDNNSIHTIEDLKGKKLALEKGFLIQEQISKDFPDIQQVEYPTTLDALFSIVQQKTDAYIGNLAVVQHLIKNHQLVTVKVAGRTPYKPVALRIGFNKNIGEMPINIINKALAKITPAAHQEITQRWIGINVELNNHSHARKIKLTPTEREWLKQHPEYTIGTAKDYPPFDFADSNGTHMGITADYIELITKYTGLNFKVHTDIIWDDLLKKVETREIDGVATIYKNNERAKYIQFSTPFFTAPEVLVIQKEVENIHSINHLQGKTLAVEKGYLIESKLQENYPQIKLKLFPDSPQALIALSQGKVDAYIGNMAVVTYLTESHQLTNLKVSGVSPFEPENIHIGIRNDWPIEAISIINKGLEAITPKEHRDILRRWIGVEFEAPHEDKDIKIKLTKAEKNFIRHHKPLIFSEVDWEPLSIISNGKNFSGIIDEYLSIITRRSGLKFEFQPSATWTEVIDKYISGKIDVIPALSIDDKINRKIILSNAFTTFPLVIVTNDDVTYIKDTSELNGKTVSVGRGYTSYHFIKNNYPTIHTVEADNVKEALLMVANGSVDAFIGHMAVTIDQMQKLGLRHLKIAGETEYKFDHRIGVDPKYEEAIPIINKALASISTQEHRQIASKWLKVKYESIDYSLLWKIVLIAAVFIAIIFYWNRKLSREVEKRRTAEDRFLQMATNIPGAIFQATVKNKESLKFTYISKGIDVYFSLKEEDLINGRINFSDYLLEKDQFQQKLKKANKLKSDFDFIGKFSNTQENQLQWIKILGHYGHDIDGKAVYNGLILDITKQKLAEQDLLASERKISAMSRAVNDALVMIDCNDKIRFWNPAAEKLFGYSATDAIDKDFHNIVTPERFLPQVEKGMKNFSLTGDGSVIGKPTHINGINKSGKEFPAEITVSSFQIDNEWFAVGMIRDITTQLEAENKLRKSEEKFRIIANYTYDWESWFSNKGALLWVNPSVERLTGYTVDECFAMSDYPARFFLEDDIHIVEEIKKAANTGQTGKDIPFRLKHKNGSIAWATVSWNLVYDHDNQSLGLRTSVRDFSDRKKAEDALAESEERGRLILESAGEGIIGVDSAGCITFVNPAALSALQYSQNEIIGANIHNLIHHTHKEGSKYFAEDCPLSLSYTRGIANYVEDDILWRKNNTFFSANFTSTPIKKENAVIGAVITFNDITQRKKVETELRQNMDDLERFNKLVVGREEKMIQLKNEINSLRIKLGSNIKYKIVH